MITRDYLLRLHGVVGGKEIVNTFYYKCLEADGTASILADLFQINVLPQIADTVSSATVFNRIYTYNFLDPGNFNDQTINVPGTRNVAVDVRFVAWYFKYHRSNREKNDGRKMIGVPAEADITASAPTATALGLLNIAATAMGQLLVDALPNHHYVPCIGRYILQPPDAEHEKAWYELLDLEEAVGVSFVKVSHQVSRA